MMGLTTVPEGLCTDITGEVGGGQGTWLVEREGGIPESMELNHKIIIRLKKKKSKLVLKKFQNVVAEMKEHQNNNNHKTRYIKHHIPICFIQEQRRSERLCKGVEDTQHMTEWG